MTRTYITPALFGPQAEQLRLFLDQVDEAPSDRWTKALPAARAAAGDAARISALGAARDVARDATWSAVRATVRDATEAAGWAAVRDATEAAGWAAAWAAAALVVRDLISAEHYDELTRVVRAAGFVVHPDDGPLP